MECNSLLIHKNTKIILLAKAISKLYFNKNKIFNNNKMIHMFMRLIKEITTTK